MTGSIPRPRLRLSDLGRETSISLTARPTRTALTSLGTVIGIAALVATLGTAATASNQIISHFDELVATRVTVNPVDMGPQTEGMNPIPWDSEQRLLRLNGVNHAGTLSELDLGDARVTTVPLNDPLGQSSYQVPVFAASPGLYAAARATILTGRTHDWGHETRGDDVAVLGPAAARRLNINNIASRPAIFVGDQPLTVIGILADTVRQPELLSAIITTNSWAQANASLPAPSLVLIDTELGAAELIGTQAPIALAPADSEQLQATVPPTPTRARDNVQGDLDTLFLLLGAISLLVGTIGIANVTLVSVIERTPEIGLRRAQGATPRHIAIQFLAESATLGTLGGIIGATLGIFFIVSIAHQQAWSPTLDPRLALLAPLVGNLTGIIAGIYPARKATRISPVQALQQ